jgi:hypothetical protein
VSEQRANGRAQTQSNRMEDEIKVNGKRSQTVQINEINSSHSHSIRIQFVCLILFIILFLITLSALIAIIFIFGLQNRE